MRWAVTENKSKTTASLTEMRPSYLRGKMSLPSPGAAKLGKKWLPLKTEERLTRFTRAPGVALTAAGPLVALVRAVQEAITALGEHDARLAVLTLELPARTGQGAVCGCNRGDGALWGRPSVFRGSGLCSSASHSKYASGNEDR